MVGGLFGDLPPPSKQDEKENEAAPSTKSNALPWSVSRMAPPTLRKSAPFAPPPQVRKPQSASSAAVVQARAVLSSLPTTQISASWSAEGTLPTTINNSSVSPSPITPTPIPSTDFTPPSIPALVAPSAGVVDEYDPTRPNDYEEYCRERKRVQAQGEMRREMEKRIREEEEKEKERENELKRLRELEKSREAEREQKEGSGTSSRGHLNLSGEEAWKRRALLSNGGKASTSSSSSSPFEDSSMRRSPSPPRNDEGFMMGNPGGLAIGSGGQISAAERMMAKMGWKAGQGLGKQEQGITTPLMARKTDRRAGVIVNASALEKDKEREKEKEREREEREKEKAQSIKAVKFNSPPTHVVLLRNMVGPGEVDVDLEEEVAGECTKYGTVTRVLIFEITEPGFPPTEAVRIFIQFQRVESATKALVDLDGRYFGGRVVRASFYDEDRFDQNELGPVAGEVPSTGV